MIVRSRAPLRNTEMNSVLPGEASDAIHGVPAAMAEVRAIGARPQPRAMHDFPGRRGDAVVRCIRRSLFELLAARGRGRTVCPSEVAQVAAVDLHLRWQDLMPNVGAVARTLAEAGVIEAIQHEAVVDPNRVRGPIRLRLREVPAKSAVEHLATESGEHATIAGRGQEGECT